MNNVLKYGGFISGAVLVLFGVAVIALGFNGRSTVGTELKQEKIVGSDDMTPALIKEAASKAGLEGVTFPSCSVAGDAINSGTRARCFAQYMRIHALESSGGLTYAEMGRFATTDGNPAGTSDTTKALMANGQPVSNAARNTWVTETALATALNMSYMAERLAMFSIVIGIALLLTGIGFIILDWAVLARRRAVTDASGVVAGSQARPNPGSRPGADDSVAPVV
jgi:hypothetical protein